MADFRVQVIVDPSRAVSGSRRVNRELRGIENSADRVRRSLGAAFAVLGSAAFLANAIRQTGQFQTAIAEVSTLVDRAVFDVNRLEQAALDQAGQFGQDPQQQARALYQIISAGASDAAEAIAILDASNRLAIGGVTDVSVAAGGLTSILNAYGLSARSAADVSDILFVGVRSGITTIDQLSTTLGRVAPIAATAGVELDELVATVAALTTGGISTAESVTGVRAILASIIRPTSEAAQFAQQLGIEFNSAALRSQGLAGVLQNVIDATGGSTEAIARLFTGTEALVPVLALTGAAGDSLQGILEQMGDRAGSTQAAFEEISGTFEFQLNRVIREAETAIQQLLIPALEAITPILQFVADNFDNLVQSASIAATVLGGPFAARAIPAAIAGVRALTLALAANPFGAIAVAITLVVSTFIGFADQIRIGSDSLVTFGDLGRAAFELISEGLQFIVDGAATVVNFFRENFRTIFDIVSRVFQDIDLSFQGLLTLLARGIDTYVGLWTGARNAIITAVQSIPAALERIFVTAFNAISRRFTGFINGIIRGINAVANFAGLSGIAELEAVELEATTTFGELGGNVAQAFADGLAGSTAAEDAVNALFDRAEQIANDRIETNALTDPLSPPGTPPVTPPTLPTTPGVGGAAGVNETNEALRRQADLLREITGNQAELATRASDLRELFDTGQISAQQFTEAMRDLNVEVTALDNSFSGGLANGFARIAQRANDLGRQMSDFVVNAFDMATDAIVEFARTGEFNVRQFFQDLFAQLLRLATNQLFAQLVQGFGLGGGGGGGGGFLSSLFGFQNGGSFMVGGSGGPDSQLVAFRATPNERVTISTPGQQRAEDSGGTTVVSSPPPNVLVQITPRDITQALAGTEGDDFLVQGLERNATAVRSILGA